MKNVIILCLLCISVSAFADSPEGKGLKYVKSNYDFETTVNRVRSVLEHNGMRIPIVIDHAAAAQSVGLELPPTTLIIFGNPKVGTPLMKCQRSVAIDLPQKFLVYEDSSGSVLLAYNDPKYQGVRHKLKQCRDVLKNISNTLASFATAATK